MMANTDMNVAAENKNKFCTWMTVAYGKSQMS